MSADDDMRDRHGLPPRPPVDHTRDVPPHQHGGTDAPECTTCRPAVTAEDRDGIGGRPIGNGWWRRNGVETVVFYGEADQPVIHVKNPVVSAVSTPEADVVALADRVEAALSAQVSAAPDRKALAEAMRYGYAEGWHDAREGRQYRPPPAPSPSGETTAPGEVLTRDADGRLPAWTRCDPSAVGGCPGHLPTGYTEAPS